jgi:hypothetical protein
MGYTNGGRNLCKGELFVGSAFYGWITDSYGIRFGGAKVIPYAMIISGGLVICLDQPRRFTRRCQSKAIHTRDNGFGGVFIWELGFDVPANQSNSLLKAIHEVMPYSSGPSFVCNTSTPFNLNNPPPGTISWSKSNNITDVSGQGSTEYKVKAIFLTAKPEQVTLAVAKSNPTSPFTHKISYSSFFAKTHRLLQQT